MRMSPSTSKKLAAIILIGVLVTLGVWLKKVGGFADAMGCADQLMQQADSPDRTLSAFKFERKCGATAPDSLQVSIQPFGTDFDAEKYPPFLVMDSRANAALTWGDKKNLTVMLGNVTKTYRSERESAGVHIRYEQ